MELTLTAVQEFDPTPYHNISQNLDAQKHVTDENVDMVSASRSAIVDNWEGEAALAFAARSKSAEMRGRNIADIFREYSHVLSWYAGAKNEACKHVLDVVEYAVSCGLRVSDRWDVSVPPKSMAKANESLLEIKKIEIQSILNFAVIEVIKVDSQAISLLSNYSLQKPVLTSSHTTSNGYTTGNSPDRNIKFDNFYPFGSKRGEATWEDYLSWWKWEGYLRGGQAARPDLDDALPMYEHYRDGSGIPRTFDLEEGYREDSAIKAQVDEELSQVITAADELAKDGYTSTEFHSENKTANKYPVTENWQKTVGGYSYYSDSKLTVVGDTVTLETTVTARDRWNFDAGKSDNATGTPDSENGRFEELGWAQSFDTSGTVTRTYTWKVGEEPPIPDASDTTGGYSRDGGRGSADEARGGRDDQGDLRTEGGGRYPRAEPGGDDKVNRYPDGREY